MKNLFITLVITPFLLGTNYDFLLGSWLKVDGNASVKQINFLPHNKVQVLDNTSSFLFSYSLEEQKECDTIKGQFKLLKYKKTLNSSDITIIKINDKMIELKFNGLEIRLKKIQPTISQF